MKTILSAYNRNTNENFCYQCGSKKQKRKKLTNYFNENTGKQEIEIKKICMNPSCDRGVIDRCNFEGCMYTGFKVGFLDFRSCSKCERWSGFADPLG